MFRKTMLKGGSLSSTYLIEDEKGLRVRKSVRMNRNREYGFNRWASQLKFLQNVPPVISDLYPVVMGTGSNGETAWFDLTYIPGKTVYETIKTEPGLIPILVEKVVEAATLHHQNLYQNTFGIELFCDEEIGRSVRFIQSIVPSHRIVSFNGKVVPSLFRTYRDFCEVLKKMNHSYQGFCHGNMTLSNMIYNPEKEKIMFIDPYAETRTEVIEGDISQIVQSCVGYEFFSENMGSIHTEFVGDCLEITNPFSSPEIKNLSRFYSEFMNSYPHCINPLLVDYMMVAQFCRMLPFKMIAQDFKGVRFFMAFAAFLINQRLGQDDVFIP